MGIIIAAVLMNLSYSVKAKFKVEEEARKMGMIYPTEIRAIDLE